MMKAATAVGGRQMQRSGNQNHRQCSSDQVLLDSFSSVGGGGGKWQQSGFSSLQKMDYSRMLRSSQREMSGELAIPVEPSTPPECSRTSSQRKMVPDVSSSDLSPGILDLHNFDTELLADIAAPGFYDRAPQIGSLRGRGSDALQFGNSANKQIMKDSISESNLSVGFVVDKEKPGSVAKIKVVVRKRPLNKKEIAKKEEDVITIEQHTNSLTVHETKLKVDLTEFVEKHEFVFDSVLDEDVSNDQVYRETVEPIIPAIFQRTKATCFAYGQTGNGKTYTMQPLPLRASQDILRLMNHTYRNQGLQLFVSFFEIYGGKLFDLLSDRRKLCMREDGKQQVCIVGLQEYRVSYVETIRELIERGNASRSTGTTGANEESSRSHAILQLAIKRLADDNQQKHKKRSADNGESKPARVVGKISFIDLAGSERGADTTDNDKQTRIEGAEINKSLLALKECIRALDNDQLHIPFRGSKLTEVLRDSFIGNSRTVMISCISPSSGSCEHTLNTLRYADRVKSLTKNSNPKKDLSSAAQNTIDSAPVPLPSVIPKPVAGDNKHIGQTNQIEREVSPPINLEQFGRENVRQASSTSNHSNRSRGSTSPEVCDDVSDGPYEQRKRFLRNVGSNSEGGFEDKTRIVASQMRATEDYDMDIDNSNSDDDLNDLLKEEEDLVIAHRRQVEETLNFVREEMKLLDEVDQPGNQLDEYITKLSVVLSRKAAGIVNLQTRLAHFQRLLTHHNVLVSSSSGQ
ncbi:hypothetical protein HPP92_000495 [Vanilla planifolia]|uniref:Kinesin-like protein n=1 Tax=Vanilla planifolia TaxID=51239 RepID=A0A835VKM6_VANPL|nr:hypothetical protein HPP92_000495 [Vanilla planifolia]